MSSDDETPVVAQFYSGKNILITGGAGFIGKVLIEKLLRSCPKIGKIYLIMRAKRGLSVEERIQKITNLPIFDKIKEEHPEAIPNKLRAVLGNMSELRLGLSEEDRKTLIEDVNVVFNCAASIRFDDPLQDAILLNTRGTRELCNLALEFKNICVFMHISTTYCNTDKQVIDEKLYPPHADWRKSIEIAEKVDKHTLQILSAKYTDKLPNTYTFTKSLAEHVVVDLLHGKVPAVVFRPSIVIASIHEPVEGWIDNLNGPMGLMIACAKGVLRCAYLNPDVIADYMPVDIAVRGMISSAWHQGKNGNTSDVAFYNCSSYGHQPITMGEMITTVKKLRWDYPSYTVMWYPGGGVTYNKTYYYFNVIFLHLLPAFIVDTLLKILKKKPLLVKIQRKIFTANIALQYFIMNQWHFTNHKLIALEANLPKNCRNEFGYDRFSIDIDQYFRNAMKGGRKYLLKDYTDFDVARRQMFKMYLLDRFVKVVIILLLAWLLFFKLDILTCMAGYWNRILRYLLED